MLGRKGVEGAEVSFRRFCEGVVDAAVSADEGSLGRRRERTAFATNIFRRSLLSGPSLFRAIGVEEEGNEMCTNKSRRQSRRQGPRIEGPMS